MGVPASFGVGASGVSPLAGDQANGVVQGTLSAVGVSQPFAIWGSMNLFLWASYNSALTTTANSLSSSIASAGAVAAGEAINSVNAPPGTIVGAITGTTITLSLPTLSLYGKTLSGQSAIRDLLSTTNLLGATVTGLGVPANTTVSAITVPAVLPSQFNPAGTRGVVALSNANTVNPQNNQPTPFTFKLGTGAITVSGADSAALFTGADIVYIGNAQLERSFDGGLTWLLCNIGGGGQMAQWSAGTPVSVSFSEPERQVLYRVNVTALSSGNVNYRISATGQAATVQSLSGVA